MIERFEASFVTTTTHGSWLPGDARGYVERGQILPPEPALAAYVKSQMKTASVNFSPAEQNEAFEALVDATLEFEYQLSDVVIEPTHVHWIIAHGDEMETMVGRLKNRMRQRVNRGRIWTAGYCGFELRTLKALQQAREYLSRHAGIRMLAGQTIARPPTAAPGSARG
jgi:hypothetical protein